MGIAKPLSQSGALEARQSFVRAYRHYRRSKTGGSGLFHLFEQVKIAFDFREVSVDLLWPSKCQSVRLSMLRAIDNNSETAEAFADEFMTHVNDPFVRKFSDVQSLRRQLYKYFSLFYSIKQHGFDEARNRHSHSIAAIDFGSGVYLRLNGSHRCSVLTYLGYQHAGCRLYTCERIAAAVDIPHPLRLPLLRCGRCGFKESGGASE